MTIQHADVLPNLIAPRAAEDPDRPYLVGVSGASRSHGDVHDASLRRAAALSQLGVADGTTVLSMLPTSFPPVEAHRFMVPRHIEVVDELPKTPTCKVRKADLRDSGVDARTGDRQASAVRVGV